MIIDFDRVRVLFEPDGPNEPNRPNTPDRPDRPDRKSQFHGRPQTPQKGWVKGKSIKDLTPKQKGWVKGKSIKDLTPKWIQVMKNSNSRCEIPQLWDGHTAERIVEILLRR